MDYTNDMNDIPEISQDFIKRLEKVASITNQLITYQNIKKFMEKNEILVQSDEPEAYPNCITVSRPLRYNQTVNCGWSFSDCYYEGVVLLDLEKMGQINFYEVHLDYRYTFVLDTVQDIEEFHKRYVHETMDRAIKINWKKVIEDGIGAVGNSGIIKFIDDLTMDQRKKYGWYQVFSVTGFMIMNPQAIKRYGLIKEEDEETELVNYICI